MTAKVTISLSEDLINGIDRHGNNRDRFIEDAVRRELERRRQAELACSLKNPHPESAFFAEQGLEEWSGGLPEEDVGALLDPKAGKGVRWVPGEGWVEDGE